jgi:hypothetical protein
MKRGKKTSEGGVIATRDFVKSTYLLDRRMKENLQYLALSLKKEQSDIVREALSAFIEKAGLDPSRSPEFVFQRKTKAARA